MFVVKKCMLSPEYDISWANVIFWGVCVWGGGGGDKSARAILQEIVKKKNENVTYMLQLILWTIIE